MQQILGLWLLGLLVLASGCATRQHYQLQDLPLPTASATGCCWQATQHLHIQYREQTFDLNAALARTGQGASLVLLDPLGRRLFSIHQQGDALETWRSPELPLNLPEHFLLASSMLAWWPVADWEHLRGSDWSLVTEVNTPINTHQRQLYFRHQPLLTMSYSDADSARAGMPLSPQATRITLELQHHKIPLRILVNTIQWGAL